MSLAKKFGFASADDLRQVRSQIQNLQNENQALRSSLARSVNKMRGEARTIREDARKNAYMLDAAFVRTENLLEKVAENQERMDTQIQLLRREIAELREELSKTALAQTEISVNAAALKVQGIQIESDCLKTWEIANQLKELAMLLLVSDVTGRLPKTADDKRG